MAQRQPGGAARPGARLAARAGPARARRLQGARLVPNSISPSCSSGPGAWLAGRAGPARARWASLRHARSLNPINLYTAQGLEPGWTAVPDQPAQHLPHCVTA